MWLEEIKLVARPLASQRAMKCSRNVINAGVDYQPLRTDFITVPPGQRDPVHATAKKPKKRRKEKKREKKFRQLNGIAKRLSVQPKLDHFVKS